MFLIPSGTDTLLVPEIYLRFGLQGCVMAAAGLFASPIALAQLLFVTAWAINLWSAVAWSLFDTRFLVAGAKTHGMRIFVQGMLEFVFFFLVICRRWGWPGALVALAMSAADNRLVILAIPGAAAYFLQTKIIENVVLLVIGMVYCLGFFIPDAPAKVFLFGLYALEGFMILLLVKV